MPATLVDDSRSHRCAIPAPFSVLSKLSRKENVTATCPTCAASATCSLLCAKLDHYLSLLASVKTSSFKNNDDDKNKIYIHISKDPFFRFRDMDVFLLWKLDQ